MRDMKKINKVNMCIELWYNLLSRNILFDVNMWDFLIIYLYLIMVYYVVLMCLIINYICYMIDLVRMIKFVYLVFS